MSPTDKQTEQALTSSLDSALALAEANSDYVANVSHEIRSPLHAILGFSELLQHQLESEGRRQAGSGQPGSAPKPVDWPA